MREIKFRAWNGTNIISANKIRENGNLALAEGLTSKDLLVIPTPKYEVMQYTGLKDKKGVEIYEGDIVCYKGLNLSIEWIENRSCFMTVLKEKNKLDVRYGFRKDMSENRLEVIGNIYENPELLKEN